MEYLKMYIKTLLHISVNKNEVISKIFYQYKVVDFLTREIDLEFEISNIKERFLKFQN